MRYMDELDSKRKALAQKGQELREVVVLFEDLGPFGQRLVVEHCPFCGERHDHGIAAGELEWAHMKSRVAHCFGGEYFGDIT